jgi:hypothetical protein
MKALRLGMIIGRQNEEEMAPTLSLWLYRPEKYTHKPWRKTRRVASSGR